MQQWQARTTNALNRNLSRAPAFQRGFANEAIVQVAFKVDDETELLEKQAHLEAKGVAVRGVVDHGWCRSIYFRDPNFLQLEYCCLTETLGEKHRAGRFDPGWTRWARR